MNQRACREVELPNELATAEFARSLANELSPPLVVALVGELGVGKTTFVRYLVEALGGTEAVSSPSYVLCHEYATDKARIEHWDLYRLQRAEEELYEAPSKNTLRLVEWADRDAFITASCHLVIEFYGVEGERRLVKLFQNPS